MPIIRIPARASRVPSRGGKSFKGGKRPAKGPKKLPPSPRRDSVSSVASSSSLSSPANLSNDDGYSGVEDVGDSDDDGEDHVLAAEQEHIANERSFPRPTPDFDLDMDADNDDDADDADDDDSDDDSSPSPKNLHKSHGGGDDFAHDISSSEAESWNGFNDEQDQSTLAHDDMEDADANTPVGRHVHFELPHHEMPHSDTDSDDEGGNHDEFFPDIFVPEEALDSGFRQEIGLMDDHYSSDSQTYWDHHGDDGFEGFSDDEVKNSNAPDNQDDMFPYNEFFPMNFRAPAHDLPWENMADMLPFRNPLAENGRSNEATAASTPSMVPDLPMEEEESDESDDGYDCELVWSTES